MVAETRKRPPQRLPFGREGGRADEGGGLENRWRGDPLVGSNPTPPAERARPTPDAHLPPSIPGPSAEAWASNTRQDGSAMEGLMRTSRKSAWSVSAAAVTAVLLVTVGAGSGRAEPGRRFDGPRVQVSAGSMGGAGAAVAGQIAGASTATVPTANATLATVDTTAYPGFENAIWASSRQRVYVAYKRFPTQPAGTGGEVRLARLCVARSVDGGTTWTTTIVDPDAGDGGDTIDDSVAIGGAGGTVYVAYLAQRGESYEDMRLKIAKSTDGGKTWTTGRIARGGVGEFTSIKVVDENNVLVATNWTKVSESQTRLYSTDDGGATWTRSGVDDFGWYTGVDQAADGRTWVTYYHPGDTDQYLATGPSATGPWTTMLAAGAPADGLYTGIGASIAVSPSGVVFLT